MKKYGIFRFFSLILTVALMFGILPPQQILAASKADTVNSKIDEIVSGIPASSDTDAEKALYLHDYIVEHCCYETGSNDQTAYGALIDGKAVCTGYSEAYQMLLAAVGIESVVITGESVDSSGFRDSHSWNMVWLNGECYFTDVTWDDPFIDGVQQLRYTYFNVSLEQISMDHFPDDASAALLPASCNHKDLDYFSMRCGQGSGVGIFDDGTTPREAARYFLLTAEEDGIYTFSCTFRFDGSDAYTWAVENWADIAMALDFTGSVNCSMEMYSVSGRLDITGMLEEDADIPEYTETAPEPTETEPEPTETEPEPTETEPKPTDTEPEFTEAEPEPTGKEPEPTETEPELPEDSDEVKIIVLAAALLVLLLGIFGIILLTRKKKK